ncbi:MAG: GNAT family N-acetyltransferase [Bacteroidetes bacterium]|nr:GNAT family N-acetyltransferase [Bacteroidota bacterium]
MLVKIRKASSKDVSDILNLIRELAAFEREPDAVEVSIDELIRDGFGEQPLFHVLIAEMPSGEIAGMALYYVRYSTWKGKTLHLEDLIVKNKFRSQGIGSQLFDAFLKIVRDEKVRRAEWVVLDWNQNAIDFYEKNGANILKDWHLVQIDQKAVQRKFNS